MRDAFPQRDSRRRRGHGRGGDRHFDLRGDVRGLLPARIHPAAVPTVREEPPLRLHPGSRVPVRDGAGHHHPRRSGLTGRLLESRVPLFGFEHHREEHHLCRTRTPAPVPHRSGPDVRLHSHVCRGSNRGLLLHERQETARRPSFFWLDSFVFFCFFLIVWQFVLPSPLSDQMTRLPNSVGITATLGLVIHAAADGFALGAVVATAQVSVQVIVFFAVILHKAPAAFGLVSFLMHAGLEKKFIQGHLLAFSAAAPIVAISTYFILHASGSSSQNQLSATGVGMLFSAGTFLYVATVHVLPEVSGGRTEPTTSDLQEHPGAEAHPPRHLGLLESLTLVLGTGLPVALAAGLQDD